MRSPFQVIINIPEPCHEDWVQMTSAERGRFCTHCQKQVIDFTTWSDRALFDFFKQPVSVCGRFKSAQLNNPIHIPYQPYSKLYRIAIALGLVVLSTSPLAAQTYKKAPLTSKSVYIDTSTIDTSTVSFHGVVLNLHYRHLKKVFVSLVTSDGQTMETYTDKKGNYSFTKVPLGVTTITFQSARYRETIIKGPLGIGDHLLPMTIILENKNAGVPPLQLIYEDLRKPESTLQPELNNHFLILGTPIPTYIAHTINEPQTTKHK